MSRSEERFGATSAVQAFSLDLLVEAQAPEALRSLARWLGITVAEVMALQETRQLGAAIEKRNAHAAAERRSQCGCGCQDRAMSPLEADAIMRRRLIPAR